VGKTTTVTNTAAALARMGARVLAIDLDPQAHLTIHLGVEPDSAGPGAYEILTQSADIKDAIRQVRDNLCLIPTNVNLVGAESELVSVVGREVILSEAVETVEDRFDYLFIDCPPSLGLLTLNALAAVKEVLIPLQPHFLALQGFGKLLQTVEIVSRRINPGLKVSGVLLCMYDSRALLPSEVKADIEQFLREARGTRSAWSEARIIPRLIRRNIKLAEAPSYGKTIFEYEPGCNGAEDYAAVAQYLHKQTLTAAGLPADEIEAVIHGPQPAGGPAAAQEHKSTSAQEHKSTSAQEHKCTSAQEHKCTSAQEHKSTRAQESSAPRSDARDTAGVGLIHGQDARATAGVQELKGTSAQESSNRGSDPRDTSEALDAPGNLGASSTVEAGAVQPQRPPRTEGHPLPSPEWHPLPAARDGGANADAAGGTAPQTATADTAGRLASQQPASVGRIRPGQTPPQSAGSAPQQVPTQPAAVTPKPQSTTSRPTAVSVNQTRPQAAGPTTVNPARPQAIRPAAQSPSLAAGRPSTANGLAPRSGATTPPRPGQPPVQRNAQAPRPIAVRPSVPTGRRVPPQQIIARPNAAARLATNQPAGVAQRPAVVQPPQRTTPAASGQVARSAEIKTIPNRDGIAARPTGNAARPDESALRADGA